MKVMTKIIMVTAIFALPITACSNANEHMDDGQTHNEKTVSMVSNISVEVKNVENVMENYSKQITAKDLKAMEAYVLADGDDFTIFEGKGTNIGWADYRDNHLAPELADEDLVFTKYDFINFKTNVSGDLATVTFSIDAAYNYKGKEASHMRHGTAILKKIDGQWKIAHMQT